MKVQFLNTTNERFKYFNSVIGNLSLLKAYGNSYIARFDTPTIYMTTSYIVNIIKNEDTLTIFTRNSEYTYKLLEEINLEFKPMNNEEINYIEYMINQLSIQRENNE